MPTNLLHTANQFKQEDVIPASAMGLLSPRALTVDASKIEADANAKKIIRPGMILYKITGSELGRVGCRTKLESAITTSSTSLALIQQGKVYQSETAQFFAEGDVLKVIRPYGTVILANTWAANDTATVTIDGHPVTYEATSATLSDIATALATAINTDAIAGQLVDAIADGAVVYLFAKQLKAYSLAAAESTAGTGTATTSGTELVGNTTIGTINTNGIDLVNGTVTLTSTAAIALPAGAPIGIDATPWGLVIGAHDASKADTDVTGFTGGPVYGERLPYWDQDIASAMPQLTFV